jgi:hypothetical protein
VARITNSIIAPRDHAFRFFGEEGILSVEDGWVYGTRIFLTKKTKEDTSFKAQVLKNLPGAKSPPSTLTEEVPLVRKADYRHRYNGGSSHQMDIARGVADLAQAITSKRQPHMSAQFALHVNEIVLTLQYPERMGSPRTLTTTFSPMEPMPWAQA